MTQPHHAALLWALTAIDHSDFTDQERQHLATAQQRLAANETPTPDEFLVLADVALVAGTLMVADYAGATLHELPGQAPTVAELEAAQTYCEAQRRALVAV
ncbi:hypothetical protein [Deinococcus soli (ex Cha et al. 2016)]|uniref:hypothetical protein n=1 Tax=Deinococcus soli (ex Cha et al. 2016) TaxID=1309411 RepID=UPI00166E2D1C|nr:hypothetical protein [Deinococcus soli (ex Cha et al. 2016)]GGB70810.1 hypothetical protein GCM10008019_28720 [Deinococcus soli (ex Cha et al. 2016)]